MAESKKHKRDGGDSPGAEESSGLKTGERQSHRDTSQLDDSSVDDALEKLDSDPENGLSPDEAEKRLQQYGPNSLEEEEEARWKKILKHFWGPIPWMIETAVILSAIARRWEDFVVITTMLLINGGVGYWHESKSHKAIKALKERLAPKADVIREGRKHTIDAANLVPGDVVIIRMGEVAPADAKLLHDQHVSMDESALTGESLPVDKEPGEMVYSGTSVKRGSGRAVVTATGSRTRFSRTAELVEAAGSKSHFQQAVLRIGYFLIGITALVAATVIFVTWILQGNPWDQVLIFALALTLAGIPQALPAVLSVTMSVGANRLARQEAIVSELASMEEIAGLEVLCVDKTGTLTLNELQLQEPVLLEAEDEHDLLVAAALTCEKDSDDPIDKAVIEGQTQKSREEAEQFRVKDFRPFDPTRKRAEADVERDSEAMTVAKGAPQVILDLVDPDEELRSRVSEQIDELGERGFRAMGVARKKGETWRYLGLLSLLDPPREDAGDVVRNAQKHGIDLRMVTGDHPAIGRQVAQQVGLGSNIVKARALFSGDERDQPRPGERVLEADGFAEVTPEDKFHIIKKFQGRDQIVGMTGDGVNDAPALQQAEVGIAVAGATDAARAASSLVLTRPGLGVIIQAVEEARRIFTRMNSYAIFRIGETLRVLLFVGGTILVLGFFPVTPIMIVLLAILNDIPIMTIAWDNASTPKQPVRWDMPRVLALAGMLAVTGVIGSFVLLWYINTHMDISHGELQTALFLKLLVAGHFMIYITRNEGWLWQRPWPSLALFLALEATQVLGTLIAIFGFLVTPIPWQLALGIWIYALVWLLLINIAKIFTIKLLSSRRERRNWEAREQLVSRNSRG
ncbi:plasma-membrane proton-efflux P-type ATPase [Marinobacter sp.]|uniref:plasma-membrane proton-efflux P-type ATPase n=1 Tax=Marinobacter sp. TaxID=50741 RepID=UPI00384BFBFD